MDELRKAQEAGSFTENLATVELGDFPYKGISEPVKIYQLSPIDLQKRNPFPPLRLDKKGPPVAATAEPGKSDRQSF
jgi:hypothetical protein